MKKLIILITLLTFSACTSASIDLRVQIGDAVKTKNTLETELEKEQKKI